MAEPKMSSLHDRVRRGEPVLWVDYVDYAERLLAAGGVSWTETAGTVAWYRQAQGLMASNVVTLPLWRLAGTLLERTPRLLEQMRAKSRVTHPLRVLMASEELRTSAVELVRALRSVFPGTLLALVLPSPSLAVLLAHRAAASGAETPEIGEDEVDATAPYVADFLRCFGDAGVDVLLLEGGNAGQPAAAGAFEWYRPVYNVAYHYGWAVGLATESPSPQLIDGVDFVIARAADRVTADLVPVQVTLADEPNRERGGFTFLCVPRDAVPERVLQSLRTISSGAGR